MPISAPQYDPNARAKTSADVKYGAAEAQLNRSIEAARMQEAAQKAALDQYGGAGRQVIGQTYADLSGNLEANRADTERQLGTQVDLVGRGYRDAAQLGNQARSDSAQRLAQLAGVIGLGGAAQADASTGVEQLAARLLSNNAQDDATRTGNLRTWAAQQDAFLRQGMAQGEREGAGRKASFENELVQALSKLQADARNQEYGLQGGLLDLLTERGAFQTSAADSYIDQLFGQQLQAGQFNLSEQEAQSQAQARAAAQALQERQYNDSLKDNSLRDMLALSEEGRAQKGFDLDYLLKQQQLNKIPEAASIDDWARQQGVSSSTVDQLMQEYSDIMEDIRRGTTLSQQGGDLTQEQRYEVNAYANQDPLVELQRRTPQGLYDPTGRNQLLSAAQVRALYPFLGGG